MEHHLVEEGIESSIYVSCELAKSFNEQMRRSRFSVVKLKSRLPGGKVYEYLNYASHCFGKNMNCRRNIKYFVLMHYMSMR